jgi:hypothetical protein
MSTEQDASQELSQELIMSVVTLFRSACSFNNSIPTDRESQIYVGKDQGDPRIKVDTHEAQALLCSALSFTMRYFAVLMEDSPGSSLDDCVKKLHNGSLKGGIERIKKPKATRKSSQLN